MYEIMNMRCVCVELDIHKQFYEIKSFLNELSNATVPQSIQIKKHKYSYKYRTWSE